MNAGVPRILEQTDKSDPPTWDGLSHLTPGGEDHSLSVGSALSPLRLTVAFEREDDGRWIADVPETPGISAYGATQAEAFAAVRKLALEVIADRLDHGEDVFTGHPEETPAEPAPFSIEITPVAVAR